MPAAVLFMTWEIVILRNDNCLVKSKMVTDTESMMGSELDPLSSSLAYHLFRKLQLTRATDWPSEEVRLKGCLLSFLPSYVTSIL